MSSPDDPMHIFPMHTWLNLLSLNCFTTSDATSHAPIMSNIKPIELSIGGLFNIHIFTFPF